MSKSYWELKIIDLPRGRSFIEYIPSKPTVYETRRRGAYVFEADTYTLSKPVVLTIGEAIKFYNLSDVPEILMKLTADTELRAPFAVLTQKGVKKVASDAEHDVTFIG